MSALRLGLLMVVASVAVAAQAERPAPAPAYPQASPADTLRYSVRAGETLIVALPARVGGAEVRYEIDQAPALSWLVDRSFMWQTLARERGSLPVRFRQLVAGREPTELVLMIDITP